MSGVRRRSRTRRGNDGGGLATPISSKPSKSPKSSNLQRYPSRFYDNLSRIWLERGALRELNRRSVRGRVPTPPAVSLSETPSSVELKRFARHGGPDNQDLRGYPEPPTTDMSAQKGSSTSSARRSASQRQSTSKSSKKSKVTTCYDRNFEQHMIDNGHQVGDEGPPPLNFDKIKQFLGGAHESTSPPRFGEEVFNEFCKINRRFLRETQIMEELLPLILGPQQLPSRREIPFTNLEKLTDGTLVRPTVDFYDGCLPSDVDAAIRNAYGPLIEPSGDKSLPCLPNFFLEGKSSRGAVYVLSNQTFYHSCFGGRAMHTLRRFVYGNEALDSRAYTLAASFMAGSDFATLAIYATYPVLSIAREDGIAWRRKLLKGWMLNSDVETFQEGAKWLRNAREWAGQRRQELVHAANQKLRTEGSACLTALVAPNSDSQDTITPNNREEETEDGRSDGSPDPIAGDTNMISSGNSETSRETLRARRYATKPGNRRSTKLEHRSRKQKR